MKGFGYFISIISVVLLGAVAWPGPNEPRWKVLAVIAGMGSSVIGMGLRWLSYRKDQRDKRAMKARESMA